MFCKLEIYYSYYLQRFLFEKIYKIDIHKILVEIKEIKKKYLKLKKILL